MAKKELIIRIDESLKTEFKKTCVMHDDTMTDVIVSHIKSYIKDKTKKVIY